MAQSQDFYRKSHALLIGIDAYQRFPALGTAVKGVRELASLLTTDLGFEPENIITLENEQATQRAIQRNLLDPMSRQEKVGSQDRVLVYFAGHGVTVDTAVGAVGYLVPVDADPEYEDTFIAMDDLTRTASERIYARHVLFLLDACFSGFATTRMAKGVRRELGDLLRSRSRQVITAGMRDQTVSDTWGPGGHSLFTGFLLEGLRGAAPTPGGILRTFHLAGYLQDQVAQHSRSRQTPQYGSLMGSQGGDFIFSVRQVSDLPDWIVAAAGSADPSQRLVAANKLYEMAADTTQPQLADQALGRLAEMADDSNSMVRASVGEALRELVPPTEPAQQEREQPIVVQSTVPPAPAPQEPLRERPARHEPAVVAPESQPAVEAGSRLQSRFVSTTGLSPITLLTMLLAVAVNIGLGTVTYNLKVPLYLDAVGTVLVGILAGPLAGVLTGSISYLAWGLSGLGPGYAAFAAVGAVIGLTAGCVGIAGWGRSWWRMSIAGLVTGLIAALSSAPVSAYVSGDAAGSGSDRVAAFWRIFSRGIWPASFAQGSTSDPVDKALTFLIVWVVVLLMGRRLRAQFPNLAQMRSILRPAFRFSTLGLVLLAIVINIALGTLISNTQVPLYLNSVGTILVGILAGPLAGAFTGLLSNLIWGFTGLDPLYAPFAAVAAVIGLASGYVGLAGWGRSWWRMGIAGLITGLIIAPLNGPIVFYMFGGVALSAADLWRSIGLEIWPTSFAQGVSSDPLDKAIAFLIVWLILWVLPPRIKALFSSDSKTDRAEKPDAS